MALILLTLMLGNPLTTKPHATKRSATTMVRGLGFGLGRNAVPRGLQEKDVLVLTSKTRGDLRNGVYM